MTRCSFGLHPWGKWGEVETFNFERPMYMDVTPVSGLKISGMDMTQLRRWSERRQRRTCPRCGAVGFRKVSL